jgi:hypothetical protein
MPFWGWLWPVLGLATFLSFPYFFSLETFFSHDDFALLWFHKSWPLTRPWVFFQTDVLTFYRPVQNYLLAVLFHFFGMNPFPYGAILVALHVANIVLFGRMVYRVFDDIVLTFLSVIFFAADWQYCDVVFWKGNYGTALSWLFVLGACNLFADHLRGGGRRSYAGSLGLLVAALMSKETAANAPLLLSLLYWARWPRLSQPAEIPERSAAAAAVERRDWRPRAVHFLRLLAPFYALSLAYVVFHRLAVRDVYTWLPKGYEIQAPWEATKAIFHALTWWLAAPVSAGLPSLASERTADSIQSWLDSNLSLHFGLAAFLVIATIAVRNRRMAFGLLWAVLAFIPANMIPDYHTPRYYYGAIMGIAILFAEILVAADRAIARRGRFAAVASARVVGSLLILAFVFSNLICTTHNVAEDTRICRPIEDLYRFLVSQRGRVPPKTLFCVRCLRGPLHFHEGMGLREMFKLALQDDSVEAILPQPDQNLTAEVASLLEREYSKPVQVFREPSGRFRLLVAAPTTSTATVAQPK